MYRIASTPLVTSLLTFIVLGLAGFLFLSQYEIAHAENEGNFNPTFTGDPPGFCNTAGDAVCAVRFTLSETTTIDSYQIYIKYFDSPVLDDISGLTTFFAESDEDGLPSVFNAVGGASCGENIPRTSVGTSWGVLTINEDGDCASIPPGEYWLVITDSDEVDASGNNFFQIGKIPDLFGHAYSRSTSGSLFWNGEIDETEALMFNMSDQLDPTPTPTATATSTSTPTPTATSTPVNVDAGPQILQESNPDSNQAGIAIFHHENSIRTIVRIDIQSLSSELPNSAVLRLSSRSIDETFCMSTCPVGGTIAVHDVSLAWDEEDVTWNDRTSEIEWLLAGGNYEDTNPATLVISDASEGVDDDIDIRTFVDWGFDQFIDVIIKWDVEDVEEAERALLTWDDIELIVSYDEPTPTPSAPTATPTPTVNPDGFNNDAPGEFAGYEYFPPKYTLWQGDDAFFYVFDLATTTTDFELQVRRLNDVGFPASVIATSIISQTDQAAVFSTDSWPLGPVDVYDKTNDVVLTKHHVSIFPRLNFFSDQSWRCANNCAIALDEVALQAHEIGGLAGLRMYPFTAQNAQSMISKNYGDIFTLSIVHPTTTSDARLVISNIVTFDKIVDVPLSTLYDTYTTEGTFGVSNTTFQMHFSTNGTAIPWLPVYDLADVYNVNFPPGAYNYAITDENYDVESEGESLLIVRNVPNENPIRVSTDAVVELGGDLDVTIRYDTAEICTTFSDFVQFAVPATGTVQTVPIELVESGTCGVTLRATNRFPLSTTLSLPTDMILQSTFAPGILPFSNTPGVYGIYVESTFRFVESCGIICVLVPGGVDFSSDVKGLLVAAAIMITSIIGLAFHWNILGILLLAGLILGFGVVAGWVSPVIVLTVVVVVGAGMVIFGMGINRNKGLE